MTYREVADALAALPDPTQPGRVVHRLAWLLDLTDAELSERTGLSRQTVSAKRHGHRPVLAADVWPLSEALGVPIQAFLVSPRDAVRLLLDSREDVLICTTDPDPGFPDSPPQQAVGRASRLARQ